MDVHFGGSRLIKVPTPEINHFHYEYPIQHIVSMDSFDSYNRIPPGDFHMMRNWNNSSSSEIRDRIAFGNDIIRQTLMSTPKTQQSNEPSNTEVVKLCVFQGEVSQTRLQRAEIIIPTENGAVTQPVVILPLKKRLSDQFGKSSIKDASLFEPVSRQNKSPNRQKSPSTNLQGTNSPLKSPVVVKHEKLDRISKKSKRKEETSPLVFNRASAPARNVPTNKRLMNKSLKRVQVKQALVGNTNIDRFQNPQPILDMPSLSPNTFWHEQPRKRPPWLTGIDFAESANLLD